MRKLKLQVQTSVDGFVAGPNGEMEWMEWNWDAALKNYVSELTAPVDCIILGRKLAEGFIPYWAANPGQEGAEKFNNTPKVVFSNTLQESQWENTVVATGNLNEEVAALKNQPGGDIIAYGGVAFVSSLIKANLIDEYHLFVNPTAIGKGLSVFNQLAANKALKLVYATPFDCGIVVLCYQPKV